MSGYGAPCKRLLPGNAGAPFAAELLNAKFADLRKSLRPLCRPMTLYDDAMVADAGILGEARSQTAEPLGSPLNALRKHLPQLVLEDLAGGVARQRGHDLQAFRRLL